MTTSATRQRDRMRQSIAPFLSFFTGPFSQPGAGRRQLRGRQPAGDADPGVRRRRSAPRSSRSDKDWFAYKLSEPRVAARPSPRTLTARTGLDWDPADVAMTNGGFAALAVALRALVEPGDEVIFLSPPWFFYEILILAAGGVPVRVRLEPPAFDLDSAAIAAAITPADAGRHRQHARTTRAAGSTRASDLAALRRAPGRCLRAHRPSDLDHRRDEPYNRIVFDGRDVPQPGRGLPAHDHHLLVRQDAAGARACASAT